MMGGFYDDDDDEDGPWLVTRSRNVLKEIAMLDYERIMYYSEAWVPWTEEQENAWNKTQHPDVFEHHGYHESYDYADDTAEEQDSDWTADEFNAESPLYNYNYMYL